VANLLNNPIRFGERDNSATRIAGFFHTKGLPRDVTLAILKNALVVEKGEHPFTIEDIRKCVESVYKYPEKERRVLDLVSLPTLLRAEDNNVAEVVSGILPKAGVCIVAGEPGTGKTWLVLALARDVATGKPFLGKFAAEQGSVLVIDEESGKYRLQKRMQKLGVTENLPIAFSIMKVINLSDPSWEEPLREVIAQQKPELVVLDSLVRIHRGDENQSTEMAKLFATLTKFREEFGCAFVITHHLRKRVQQSKLNTLEQRLRGSSDIAAYADTVLGLDRVDDRLVFSQLKNRDGEFFKPLALGIDDISDDRTEIVVLAEVDEEADKRKLARELVRKALREKPTLREELVTLAKGENIGERTLVDALKSLMDAGEIIRNMEGRKSSYRLKQPTQLTQ
jgi:RecA/RadA recombinase